jgi:hypothetical protein
MFNANRTLTFRPSRRAGRVPQARRRSPSSASSRRRSGSCAARKASVCGRPDSPGKSARSASRSSWEQPFQDF